MDELHTQGSSEQEAQTTASDNTEAEQKRLLVGILSYLSVLVVVAYLLAKDQPALHFHIKQGAVLFIIELASFVVVSMMPLLFPLMGLVHIATLVFAIIGIVNVVKKQDKELPLIGHLATHIPLK